MISTLACAPTEKPNILWITNEDIGPQLGAYDNTIIFYYADHGPGMPRSKRWPYNSGLSIPLIVRIPAKY